MLNNCARLFSTCHAFAMSYLQEYLTTSRGVAHNFWLFLCYVYPRNREFTQTLSTIASNKYVCACYYSWSWTGSYTGCSSGKPLQHLQVRSRSFWSVRKSHKSNNRVGFTPKRVLQLILEHIHHFTFPSILLLLCVFFVSLHKGAFAYSATLTTNQNVNSL